MMKNFFKSGNQYFFKHNGKITLATLQYCENCGAPCNVNSMTLKNVPSSIIAKNYNSDLDDSSEMFYDETRDMSICENC